MRVGWLCPFIDNPKMCVGAVVEALVIGETRAEYIPIILPDTPLEVCIERGGAWVLSMMTEELLVFNDRISAEGFLFDTFEAHQWGLLTPTYVEFLLDQWHGFARHASEYGLMVTKIDINLN